jgi:hypothetical protein
MAENSEKEPTGRASPATAIATAVHTVERWRARGDRGRLAALRRLGRDTSPGEAFWCIADLAQADRTMEAFLRQFLPLAALTPHRGKARLGVVMRAAGIAPSRFERWLRQPQATAMVDARRLIRRCASLDLIQLGMALYFWTEDTRVQLARDFYRNPRISSATTVVPTTSSESNHG